MRGRILASLTVQLTLGLTLVTGSACSNNKQQLPNKNQTTASSSAAKKTAPDSKAAAAAPNDVKTPDDVAAAPADAQQTASGLAYKVLKKGSGTVHPGADSVVLVHYSGWTTDGKLFDSSVKRGEPISFPLNRVIKGWTEGVQLMVEGEKARFWIPGNLAYGDTPSRPGAPAGTLVFDIELLKIK